MRAAVALAAAALLLAGCGGAREGRTVFEQDCSSCHTLADFEGKTQQDVLRALAEGPGAMPKDVVSGREAEAVAAYVTQAR